MLQLGSPSLIGLSGTRSLLLTFLKTQCLIYRYIDIYCFYLEDSESQSSVTDTNMNMGKDPKEYG